MCRRVCGGRWSNDGFHSCLNSTCWRQMINWIILIQRCAVGVDTSLLLERYLINIFHRAVPVRLTRLYWSFFLLRVKNTGLYCFTETIIVHSKCGDGQNSWFCFLLMGFLDWFQRFKASYKIPILVSALVVHLVLHHSDHLLITRWI